MDKMEIYEKARLVPPEAQKQIKGGRLAGMTDINPMWRIKTLTELFGPCGFGWKYTIEDKRLERGGKDEIAAFVDVNLYVRQDDAWSEAIPGTGGASFVSSESKGLYTSDECFKMALTDAISVACKALGFGADIYWSKDNTKYDRKPEKKAGEEQLEALKGMLASHGWTESKALANISRKYEKKVLSMEEVTEEQALWLLKYLEQKAAQEAGRDAAG